MAKWKVQASLKAIQTQVYWRRMGQWEVVTPALKSC